MTHVLLPVVALLRRADLAVTIGAALAAKARGVEYRRIAAVLGRPAETVRDWLRRFAGRVEAVRVLFTWWLRAVVADPVMPGPAGSAWADAITAISVVASAVVAPVWARRGGAVAGCGGGVWRAVAGAGLAVEVDQHEPTLTRRRCCLDPVRLSFVDQAKGRLADGGQRR